MKLRAPALLRNSEVSFRDHRGYPVFVRIDENGLLSLKVQTGVILDGDGNRLRVVEVPGEPAGEPDKHYFAFENDEIPPEYDEFVVQLDIGAGETVVPARYVRGAHMEKVDEELSQEAIEHLLADTSLGPLLQLEVDEAADEEE